MNNNEFNEMPQFQSFESAPVETPVPQFNIPSSEPVQPVQPAPVAEPVAPAVPQFDIFANAQPAPAAVEPATPQIDMFASAQPAPVAPVVEPVAPAQPTLDSFTTAPVQENPFVQPEVKPEPIIITDYNGTRKFVL